MSTTVEEFEAMCTLIAEKRRDLDELSALRKAKDAELEELERRMMLMLEENDRHDWHGKAGTIYISSRESVRVPKDLEEKRKLFGYLKERGIFEEMVSVNSQTLNAFYRAEKAAAEESGNWSFSLPGVGEPTVDQILSFRKAK